MDRIANDMRVRLVLGTGVARAFLAVVSTVSSIFRGIAGVTLHSFGSIQIFIGIWIAEPPDGVITDPGGAGSRSPRADIVGSGNLSAVQFLNTQPPSFFYRVLFVA